MMICLIASLFGCSKKEEEIPRQRYDGDFVVNHKLRGEVSWLYSDISYEVIDADHITFEYKVREDRESEWKTVKNSAVVIQINSSRRDVLDETTNKRYDIAGYIINCIDEETGKNAHYTVEEFSYQDPESFNKSYMTITDNNLITITLNHR